MNEAAVRKTLAELDEILTRPAGQAEKAQGPGSGLYLPCKPGKEPTLQESLEHLRVMLKYLVFDLEATRRENHYLRQMLENRFQKGQGKEED